MISQRDCSGHLSCKNRSVGPPFSRDWCNKRNEYCEYDDCEYDDNCHFESILVKMEAFEKWWAAASTNYMSDIEVERDRRLIEAGWKSAMEKAIEFVKTIPYKTEDERRILVALENRIEKELGRLDN